MTVGTFHNESCDLIFTDMDASDDSVAGGDELVDVGYCQSSMPSVGADCSDRQVAGVDLDSKDEHDNFEILQYRLMQEEEKSWVLNQQLEDDQMAHSQLRQQLAALEDEHQRLQTEYSAVTELFADKELRKLRLLAEETLSQADARTRVLLAEGVAVVCILARKWRSQELQAEFEKNSLDHLQLARLSLTQCAEDATETREEPHLGTGTSGEDMVVPALRPTVKDEGDARVRAAEKTNLCEDKDTHVAALVAPEASLQVQVECASIPNAAGAKPTAPNAVALNAGMRKSLSTRQADSWAAGCTERVDARLTTGSGSVSARNLLTSRQTIAAGSQASPNPSRTARLNPVNESSLAVSSRPAPTRAPLRRVESERFFAPAGGRRTGAEATRQVAGRREAEKRAVLSRTLSSCPTPRANEVKRPLAAKACASENVETAGATRPRIRGCLSFSSVCSGKSASTRGSGALSFRGERKSTTIENCKQPGLAVAAVAKARQSRAALETSRGRATARGQRQGTHSRGAVCEGNRERLKESPLVPTESCTPGGLNTIADGGNADPAGESRAELGELARDRAVEISSSLRPNSNETTLGFHSACAGATVASTVEGDLCTSLHTPGDDLICQVRPRTGMPVSSGPCSTPGAAVPLVPEGSSAPFSGLAPVPLLVPASPGKGGAQGSAGAGLPDSAHMPTPVASAGSTLPPGRSSTLVDSTVPRGASKLPPLPPSHTASMQQTRPRNEARASDDADPRKMRVRPVHGGDGHQSSAVVALRTGAPPTDGERAASSQLEKRACTSSTARLIPSPSGPRTAPAQARKSEEQEIPPQPEMLSAIQGGLAGSDKSRAQLVKMAGERGASHEDLGERSSRSHGKAAVGEWDLAPRPSSQETCLMSGHGAGAQEAVGREPPVVTADAADFRGAKAQALLIRRRSTSRSAGRMAHSIKPKRKTTLKDGGNCTGNEHPTPILDGNSMAKARLAAGRASTAFLGVKGDPSLDCARTVIDPQNRPACTADLFSSSAPAETLATLCRTSRPGTAQSVPVLSCHPDRSLDVAPCEQLRSEHALVCPGLLGNPSGSCPNGPSAASETRGPPVLTDGGVSPIGGQCETSMSTAAALKAKASSGAVCSQILPSRAAPNVAALQPIAGAYPVAGGGALGAVAISNNMDRRAPVAPGKNDSTGTVVALTYAGKAGMGSTSFGSPASSVYASRPNLDASAGTEMKAVARSDASLCHPSCMPLQEFSASVGRPGGVPTPASLAHAGAHAAALGGRDVMGASQLASPKELRGRGSTLRPLPQPGVPGSAPVVRDSVGSAARIAVIPNTIHVASVFAGPENGPAGAVRVTQCGNAGVAVPRLNKKERSSMPLFHETAPVPAAPTVQPLAWPVGTSGSCPPPVLQNAYVRYTVPARESVEQGSAGSPLAVKCAPLRGSTGAAVNASSAAVRWGRSADGRLHSDSAQRSLSSESEQPLLGDRASTVSSTVRSPTESGSASHGAVRLFPAESGGGRLVYPLGAGCWARRVAPNETRRSGGSGSAGGWGGNQSAAAGGFTQSGSQRQATDSLNGGPSQLPFRRSIPAEPASAAAAPMQPARPGSVEHCHANAAAPKEGASVHQQPLPQWMPYPQRLSDPCHATPWSATPMQHFQPQPGLRMHVSQAVPHDKFLAGGLSPVRATYAPVSTAAQHGMSGPVQGGSCYIMFHTGPYNPGQSMRACFPSS
ncbi:hypothetical protein BESB_085160 [Besnoitia besnoiti]|uniref:Uncharacterized protein n=1 Tax=Besnoitia besnoiti TaxID=94643 RepID=A0A2A9MCI3_BESBE|nr:hypothetical protein BESB_085160 [Besnoitia besnoiti]PFH33317.1 hypothetical protein BESB_085160 [Besnoitia besnoiti]